MTLALIYTAVGVSLHASGFTALQAMLMVGLLLGSLHLIGQCADGFAWAVRALQDWLARRRAAAEHKLPPLRRRIGPLVGPRYSYR